MDKPGVACMFPTFFKGSECLLALVILKEKCGKKRISLTDDQRRRLAVKGKLLGRKQLEQAGTLFTPTQSCDSIDTRAA